MEMQLVHSIDNLIKVDSQGFIVCNGKNYLTQIKPKSQSQGLKLFAEIINTLGMLSSKSQGLKQVITSIDKFILSDQRIYIKVMENKALGFIKVGEKNLFYRDYIGNVKELKPTCVLDIYVHQSCQRNGVGKEIFDKFLKVEDKFPDKLAYDRPSQKLIGFLKKHYALSKYIPQNNNYVIFDRYFQKSAPQIQKTLQNHLNTASYKTSTESFKKIKAQSQPHRQKYPQDSIQILKREMNHLTINNSNSMNNTHTNPIQPNKSIINFSKQLKEVKDNTLNSIRIGYNYPWALNNDKKNFRTTSGAYGSHYQYNK